jgi:hypothetical protein
LNYNKTDLCQAENKWGLTSYTNFHEFTLRTRWKN